MCPVPRILAAPLAALVLASFALPGAAQGVANASYALTAPVAGVEPELPWQTPLFTLGRLRLAAGGSSSGSGLSVEAGQEWFARAGLRRSLQEEVWSLGGGYRLRDAQSWSMHLTRQLRQDRLGLALRYELDGAWLRLSYDVPRRPLGVSGPGDMLRLSAGLRF